MAEGEEKFTGLARYFNSQTAFGRANVSDLTLKLFVDRSYETHNEPPHLFLQMDFRALDLFSR